jgi:hypothetical protein
VEAEYSLGHVSLVGRQLEVVRDVNSLHDEYFPLFFDLTKHLGCQSPFSCWDPARLQRAAKGARQSTGGCRNEIVDRRGVGFVNRRIYAVVLGNFRVDSKQNWLRRRRQVCPAQRALDALNTNT